jgi:antitoxin component of RelBE/YafQ-DinJ toxin-antitoxin module
MKKGREQVEEGAVVQIRIAATQKKLLMAAARRMGLSLSAWARLVMLKAEREQRAGGK